ncbi:MAG TPA: CRISPR-associated DxTHG motif protein [Desulfobacteraceae bacterium]|nr:CRISPR-associated DxTHG motif protein [Desulfobacteraceae bacterium]HDL98618.1 CRISPR-associated DxTHG motif protein [Desulfobacteraceae bacterium]HDO30440.1 CRISPR-associated DxTHG motif protein [Desulfobacteraceae bacterium]
MISHQDNQHRCRLASAPFSNAHGFRFMPTVFRNRFRRRRKKNSRGISTRQAGPKR